MTEVTVLEEIDEEADKKKAGPRPYPQNIKRKAPAPGGHTRTSQDGRYKRKDV